MSPTTMNSFSFINLESMLFRAQNFIVSIIVIIMTTWQILPIVFLDTSKFLILFHLLMYLML